MNRLCVALVLASLIAAAHAQTPPAAPDAQEAQRTQQARVSIQIGQLQEEIGQLEQLVGKLTLENIALKKQVPPAAPAPVKPK